MGFSHFGWLLFPHQSSVAHHKLPLRLAGKMASVLLHITIMVSCANTTRQAFKHNAQCTARLVWCYTQYDLFTSALTNKVRLTWWQYTAF
jgi:hypothetical protein